MLKEASMTNYIDQKNLKTNILIAKVSTCSSMPPKTTMKLASQFVETLFLNSRKGGKKEHQIFQNQRL